jgi:hypothetical protein
MVQISIFCQLGFSHENLTNLIEYLKVVEQMRKTPETFLYYITNLEFDICLN